MPNTAGFTCQKCGREVEMQTCPRRLCADCWAQTPQAKANRGRHEVMLTNLKVTPAVVSEEDSISWAEFIPLCAKAPDNDWRLGNGDGDDEGGR